MNRPDYAAYFEHAITLNEQERALQSELVPQLPDSIIDSHVHSAPEEDVDADAIPEHIQRHMMSTFPITSLEQSDQISQLLMPGIEVRKLRFAHVFPGVGKRAVNEYLVENSPEEDRVALFGLSDSPEDIEYTREELRRGVYSGLKMYYIASDPPKYGLFEYFPPEILEVAEEEEVPIILHLPHSLYRSDEEVIALAERYPDLKVVLAHVGVAHIPKPELDGVLSAFAAHPNIYADTARVHSADIVLAALKHLGKNRVLYGSDEPLNLLRTVAYHNPDLNGPRVLADFPYHWADPEEQAKWHHLAPRFVHSQWEQLEAINEAVKGLGLTPEEADRTKQAVFHDNAVEIFNF